MIPIALFIAAILLEEPPFASFDKPKVNDEEPRDLCRIRLSKTIEVEDGALRCVAISPDRKLIACGGDRFVHLFDLKSGERLQRLDGHKGAVNAVAFSPDNKLLASAGDDQTIRMWEVATWKLKGFLMKTIAHDRAPTTCLAFSPDGKTLASCTSIRQYDVWLWDVEKMLWEHYVRTTHREGCLHLTFSPDGKLVAVAGAKNSAERGGQVSLHKVNVGLQFLSSWAHEGEQPATCVAFSPDGSTVASAGSDNTVRLWDVKDGRERLKMTGPKEAKGIRAVAYLQGGQRIVTVSFEETIQLWDAGKGTLLATAAGTDKAVRSMAITSNGNLVATCGQDKVVKLWELSLPSSAAGPLRRRAMFGAQLGTFTAAARGRHD